MAIAFARPQVFTSSVLAALRLRTAAAAAPPPPPAPAPVPHPAALLPLPFHPVVIRPTVAPVAPPPVVQIAAPVKETVPVVTTGTEAAPCSDCKPPAPTATAPAPEFAVTTPAPAPASPQPEVKVVTSRIETPSDMRRLIGFLVVAVLIGGGLVLAAKVRP